MTESTREYKKQYNREYRRRKKEELEALKYGFDPHYEPELIPEPVSQLPQVSFVPHVEKDVKLVEKTIKPVEKDPKFFFPEGFWKELTIETLKKSGPELITAGLRLFLRTLSQSLPYPKSANIGSLTGSKTGSQTGSVTAIPFY